MEQTLLKGKKEDFVLRAKANCQLTDSHRKRFCSLESWLLMDTSLRPEFQLQILQQNKK